MYLREGDLNVANEFLVYFTYRHLHILCRHHVRPAQCFCGLRLRFSIVVVCGNLGRRV